MSSNYELSNDIKNNIKNILDKYKNVDGPLMMILQDVQDLIGFLPFKALEFISDELDISLEEIYGIVTFYSQFRLQQKGKYEINICLGTVCYVKGSNDVYEELKTLLNIENGMCTEDGLFSLDTTRCLGCCSLAPVLMVNDKVYGNITRKDIKRILDSYRGEVNDNR